MFEYVWYMEIVVNIKLIYGKYGLIMVNDDG